MNAAIILGRLTRDPVIKVTQGGMTIARFTLAVNRLNKTGQNPEADFINCVAFGKTADAIGNYVYKGQRLLVEGRIQTGSYTSKSGEKKFTTEIAVNRFLGGIGMDEVNAIVFFLGMMSGGFMASVFLSLFMVNSER